MNNQRAKEIVTSPVMVNVTYGNTPVYMEAVHEADQTCTIHALNQPDKKMNVPLSTLTEH